MTDSVQSTSPRPASPSPSSRFAAAAPAAHTAGSAPSTHRPRADAPAGAARDDTSDAVSFSFDPQREHGGADISDTVSFSFDPQNEQSGSDASDTVSLSDDAQREDGGAKKDEGLLGGLLGKFSKSSFAGTLRSAGEAIGEKAGELRQSGSEYAKKMGTAFGKTLIGAEVDKQYEKFGIPQWKDTGITGSMTSEEMSSSQFKEFSQVDDFAHRVIGEGGKMGGRDIPPDLSKLEGGTEKLKAIIGYEASTQSREKFAAGIKSGVLGSLDSALPAGERYERAKELAATLDASKQFNKDLAGRILDEWSANPEKTLQDYKEKYDKAIGASPAATPVQPAATALQPAATAGGKEAQEGAGAPDWKNAGISSGLSIENMNSSQWKEHLKAGKYVDSVKKEFESWKDSSKSDETAKRLQETFGATIKSLLAEARNQANDAGERYAYARRLSEVMAQANAMREELTGGKRG